MSEAEKAGLPGEYDDLLTALAAVMPDAYIEAVTGVSALAAEIAGLRARNAELEAASKAPPPEEIARLAAFIREEETTSAELGHDVTATKFGEAAAALQRLTHQQQSMAQIIVKLRAALTAATT